jgi:uncharacterized protein YkwD
VTAALSIAAPAAAADVIRVVNDADVRQAQAVVQVGGSPLRTDWKGEVAVPADPGVTLQGSVARPQTFSCPGQAPSVSFSFAADGQTHVVRVPTLTPHHAEPGLSAEEQELARLVNAERGRQRPAGDPLAHPVGPPLRSVPSLARAADSITAYLEANNRQHLRERWAEGHCSFQGYGPGLRAQDSGYTGGGNGIGEVLVTGPPPLTADRAFDQWMHSDGHRAVLMDPRSRVLGPGIVGGTGAIVTGFDCGPGAPESCDSTAAGPGGGGPGTDTGGGGGDTGGGGGDTGGGGGDTGGGGTDTGGGNTGGGGTGTGGGDTGGGGPGTGTTGGGDGSAGGGSQTTGQGSPSGENEAFVGGFEAPTESGLVIGEPFLNQAIPTVPLAHAPSARVAVGALAFGRTVPVTLTWASIGGATRYQLQVSRNGRRFQSLRLPSRAATTATRLLRVGVRYVFRVRTLDALGHVGPWLTGRTFRPDLAGGMDEAISYSGRWVPRGTPGTALEGRRAAGADESSVTFTFVGRALGWLAAPRPTGGSALIYLDGRLAARVSLAAGSDRRSRVVFARAWKTVGRHRITIRTVGRLRHAAVDVAGFAILR